MVVESTEPRGLCGASKRIARSVLAVTVLALLAAASPAQDAGARWWERIPETREIVGDATPAGDGLKVDMPLVSQDGSVVPLTVSIESPMTEDDYVTEIHLYATRNPSPELAVLRLSPLLGRAEVSTRVRLNESQQVGVIARTSTGRVLAAAREIRITTSGCVTTADTVAAADEMQPLVRVPEKLAPGKPGEVRAMVRHPMETGLRRDAAGKTIPQRIVRSFTAAIDGVPVLEVELFRAVAANPYFAFSIAPRTSGEMTFTWTEDTGRSATASASFVLG
jgi:sulfur-oxidizing protein SoxY